MGDKMDEGVVYSFEALHEQAKSISKFFDEERLWWRGHADADWALKPSVYRNEAFKVNEDRMYHSFKLQAGVRRDKCPDSEDHASWRFLMQHYGLPTRFLDWSSSMLTALFFACNDDDKEKVVKTSAKNGALWALHPGKLNHLQSDSKSSNILSGNGYKSDNDKILAIMPSHQDIRHLIQSARFTAHGACDCLKSLTNSETFCKKIIISPEGKKDISKTLWRFGIRESYLFPDLDHLSKDIQRNTKNANF